MLMHPLSPADRPLLEDLVRGNPFKETQLSFQGMDPEKLVAFHTSRILEQASHPDYPVWVWESGGRTSVWGISPSETHSTFFGIPVFSIEPVLSYKLRPQEKRDILGQIGEILETKGARVVWAKCDENEGDLVRCYASLGAEYCGTTLRMSRRLAPLESGGSASGLRVRPAREEDLEGLKGLAASSHHHSHFFRDPALPRDRKRDVFPSYLERCYGQENRPLMVAEDDAGLAGFSLLLCPARQMERLGQTIGIVDFIAVDQTRQGQGIGARLLAESFSTLMERGYRHVELKTMLDNIQGVAFYQKFGFRILSAEINFSIGSRIPKWH
jgi:ribosomal protein S18 acetylase RimI-like enzyme